MTDPVVPAGAAAGFAVTVMTEFVVPLPAMDTIPNKFWDTVAVKATGVPLVTVTFWDVACDPVKVSRVGVTVSGVPVV